MDDPTKKKKPRRSREQIFSQIFGGGDGAPAQPGPGSRADIFRRIFGEARPVGLTGQGRSQRDVSIPARDVPVRSVGEITVTADREVVDAGEPVVQAAPATPQPEPDDEKSLVRRFGERLWQGIVETPVLPPVQEQTAKEFHQERVDAFKRIFTDPPEGVVTAEQEGVGIDALRNLTPEQQQEWDRFVERQYEREKARVEHLERMRQAAESGLAERRPEQYEPGGLFPDALGLVDGVIDEALIPRTLVGLSLRRSAVQMGSAYQAQRGAAAAQQLSGETRVIAPNMLSGMPASITFSTDIPPREREKAEQEARDAGIQYARAQQRLARMPLSASTEKVISGDYSDPVGVGTALVELGLSSILQSAPAVVGQVGGFFMGGPLGSAVGAAGGAFSTEYTARLSEALQGQGLDTSDPRVMADLFALRLPGARKILRDAQQEAAQGTLALMGVEALTAWMIGRVASGKLVERIGKIGGVKGKVARGATRAAAAEADALSEGAGEAGARIAVKGLAGLTDEDVKEIRAEVLGAQLMSGAVATEPRFNRNARKPDEGKRGGAAGAAAGGPAADGASTAVRAAGSVEGGAAAGQTVEGDDRGAGAIAGAEERIDADEAPVQEASQQAEEPTGAKPKTEAAQEGQAKTKAKAAGDRPVVLPRPTTVDLSGFQQDVQDSQARLDEANQSEEKVGVRQMLTRSLQIQKDKLTLAEGTSKQLENDGVAVLKDKRGAYAIIHTDPSGDWRISQFDAEGVAFGHELSESPEGIIKAAWSLGYQEVSSVSDFEAFADEKGAAKKTADSADQHRAWQERIDRMGQAEPEDITDPSKVTDEELRRVYTASEIQRDRRKRQESIARGELYIMGDLRVPTDKDIADQREVVERGSTIVGQIEKLPDGAQVPRTIDSRVHASDRPAFKDIPVNTKEHALRLDGDALAREQERLAFMERQQERGRLYAARQEGAPQKPAATPSTQEKMIDELVAEAESEYDQARNAYLRKLKALQERQDNLFGEAVDPTTKPGQTTIEGTGPKKLEQKDLELKEEYRRMTAAQDNLQRLRAEAQKAKAALQKSEQQLFDQDDDAFAAVGLTAAEVQEMSDEQIASRIVEREAEAAQGREGTLGYAVLEALIESGKKGLALVKTENQDNITVDDIVVRVSEVMGGAEMVDWRDVRNIIDTIARSGMSPQQYQASLLREDTSGLREELLRRRGTTRITDAKLQELAAAGRLQTAEQTVEDERLEPDMLEEVLTNFIEEGSINYKALGEADETFLTTFFDLTAEQARSLKEEARRVAAGEVTGLQRVVRDDTEDQAAQEPVVGSGDQPERWSDPNARASDLRRVANHKKETVDSLIEIAESYGMKVVRLKVDDPVLDPRYELQAPPGLEFEGGAVTRLSDNKKQLSDDISEAIFYGFSAARPEARPEPAIPVSPTFEGARTFTRDLDGDRLSVTVVPNRDGSYDVFADQGKGGRRQMSKEEGDEYIKSLLEKGWKEQDAQQQKPRKAGRLSHKQFKANLSLSPALRQAVAIVEKGKGRGVGGTRTVHSDGSLTFQKTVPLNRNARGKLVDVLVASGSKHTDTGDGLNYYGSSGDTSWAFLIDNKAGTVRMTLSDTSYASPQQPERGVRGGSVGTFAPALASRTATPPGPSVLSYQDGTPIALGMLDQVRPVAMPELIHFVRTLTGKVPLVRKLRRSAGLFRQGEIKISAAIFEDEQQATMTLAHEIGHLVDYLPDETTGRGNLLGRLQTLRKYMKATIEGSQSTGTVIEPKDRARMRSQATRQAVGASGYTMAEYKNDQAVRARLKKPIAEAYKTLLEQEIARRGLVENKKVFDELYALSKKWRPFDESTATQSYLTYRKSSEELYADALSVLLNSPGLLEQDAPTFYREFFAYMDRKPEVKTAYAELQGLLMGGPDAIARFRDMSLDLMFEKADALHERIEAEKEAREKNYSDRFKQQFYDKYWPIIKKANELSKRGIQLADDVRYLLDELGMANNRGVIYLLDVEKHIQRPIEAAGMSTHVLDKYLFLHRIAEGDRSTLANPLGITKTAAAEQLEALRQDLGDEKYDIITQAARDFAELNFEFAEEAVDAGIYSRKAFDETVRPNKYTYAAFSVLEYVDRHDGVPVTLKEQMGTFLDVDRPFDATVQRIVALSRFIRHQKAKVAFRDLWLSTLPEEITKARRRSPTTFEKPRRGWGEITILEDGATQKYHVDPYIAKAFDHMYQSVMNETGDPFIKWLGNINNGVFRPMYITYNLGFGFWSNPFRDLGRLYTSLPEANIVQILAAYGRQGRTALDFALGNTDNPVVRQAIADNAIPPPSDGFLFEDRGDGLSRQMRKMHLLKSPTLRKLEQYKFLKPVEKLLEFIKTGGATLEVLPKFAAYELLGRVGVSDQERAYRIRNYFGTPNFTRKGLATRQLNTLFMFSNVMIQGLAADAQIATMPRTRGAFWFRTALIALLPKVLMRAAAEGLLDDENDQLKEFMSFVSEYDKTNYLIIPLGYQEGGEFGRKAVYLRIPHDETSRIFAGALWKATGDFHQIQDLLAFGAGQLPGLAPPLEIFVAWAGYIMGANPIDAYRGRGILSRRAELARPEDPSASLREMAQWTIDQTGLTTIATYDPASGGTTEFVTKLIPGLNRAIKVSDYGKREQQQQLYEQKLAVRSAVRSRYSKEVVRATSHYNRLQKLGDNRTTWQESEYAVLSEWKSTVYDPSDEKIVEWMELIKQEDTSKDYKKALEKDIEAQIKVLDASGEGIQTRLVGLRRAAIKDRRGE